MENDLRAGLNPADREADERRSWRGFGIGLGALLLLAAWRAWRKGGPETAWGAAALACFAASGIYPDCFRLPYRLWMPVARALARVNAWIVCSILYYLIVTPYAILARTLGARFLETEFKAATSYWNVKSKRDPAESARRSF